MTKSSSPNNNNNNNNNLSIRHLAFGIASTAKSLPDRLPLLRLWWRPHLRGCVFLDSNHTTAPPTLSFPPTCASSDTSSFRYTYRGGLRSAVRVARVLLDTLSIYNNSSANPEEKEEGEEIRWYVFGDDDTVFVADNLVRTLSKYEHERWFYVGTNSEAHEQNEWFWFEMGFGGGGFAISAPLARAVGRVLDSCLVRYPHLYGSDGRISSCLAELGVGLTHEPGFHQVDVRGDIFGLLAAHPLSPLVSLHHLDYVEPIFPNMTTTQAITHLFKAVEVDPARILQQTVCYDRWFSWTVSISWGYAVQLFERNVLLPDLLPIQQTFRPWNKRPNPHSYMYMFNTKKLPKDPCARPTVFFLENVFSDSNGVIESNYKRNISEVCLAKKGASKKIERVQVRSRKMELDSRQLRAPRRHCCDILPSSVGSLLDVSIRECGEEELIYMHP
ncbi:hypothetical protein Scep_028706 [Stephania cephalantha]|uniref:Uncharacterized protein n=1 Tax=Stephania cephalantha TaxID=152367 RepID=A0AAP0HJV3_9MAGN